jgi:putative thioredoxin
VEQARQLLSQGDADGALALLHAAKAGDPGNSNVDIAMAQAQAAAGNADKALEILEQLPLDARDDPRVKQLQGLLDFEALVATAPPEAELEQRLRENPDDSEARHLLAARKVLREDYEPALELLLELMRRDRGYGNDAARKAMVALFDLLGEDPRVPRYRSRMMNLLY